MKVTKEEFNQIKLLLNANLSKNKISKILKRSYTTIYYASLADNFEEYNKTANERAKSFREKTKEIKEEPKEEVSEDLKDIKDIKSILIKIHNMLLAIYKELK